MAEKLTRYFSKEEMQYEKMLNIADHQGNANQNTEISPHSSERLSSKEHK